jgi:hypothetical protein
MSEIRGNSVPAISYQPIGYVENAFAEPTAGERIRAMEARIVLNPTLAAGL